MSQRNIRPINLRHRKKGHDIVESEDMGVEVGKGGTGMRSMCYFQEWRRNLPHFEEWKNK